MHYMKKITASQLKKTYIEFFESKNHKTIPGASLIPTNDPSVLFTTAGMHPLVPFLLGTPHPLGKRLVDVQKCIRTGDIDEVGDNTHLTFFEMLGNWSLGDYFKKEAISWSFEFLTSPDWLGLEKERLAFTCFIGNEDAPKDNEAAAIWQSLGVSAERIAFLPKEDNWWGPAGLSGPCGPDSEMFYWVDQHEHPPKVFDPKDKRWVEIWNDVFMQYEKTVEGIFVPLKKQNVDTGLGVERVTMVLAGKTNVYETELFSPLIKKIEELSGKKHLDFKKSFRVIADHMRAATFILGDERSVTPSNVDQGYILRRFIRRIIRHARLLEIRTDSLCSELATIIITQYGAEYPLLREKKVSILEEFSKEEVKFVSTLEKGLHAITKKALSLYLQKIGIEKAKEIGLLGNDAKIKEELQKNGIHATIDAKWVFDMFQSQGMPIELTLEELQSLNVAITNTEQIQREVTELFNKHQELSRAGAQQKFKGGLADSSEQTTKLHTATHLLNEALRHVLSSDIVQKGSNITAERLRFDFNFNRKLSEEELKKIEDEVNTIIAQKIPVTKTQMPPAQAIASGAQAEFGARYPSVVSVYTIGNYSKEICMGPHVTNTAELGKFKIIKEEAVAAGIRRIKAVLE